MDIMLAVNQLELPKNTDILIKLGPRLY